VHDRDVSLNGVADVLVVGAGPAGSALAAACSDVGLRTMLVDRAPERPWRATYGSWAHELPPLPAEAIAARATTVRAFALTEHRLDGEYVVLHNENLRRHLSRSDIETVAGRAESITPTEVRLADGRTLRARLVVDATGAPRGRHAEQTAVGVVLPAEVLAPGEAMFMDWRLAGDPPTFCYALPLDGERVLVEETSLAHLPGLSFGLLRERLHRRLAVHGWPLDRPEHERVRFPLNPPLVKVLCALPLLADVVETLRHHASYFVSNRYLMTPRKFRTPHNSIDGLEENQQGPGSIRAKLQSASKEKLIELIERLAADSEKLSARIDYLTDSGTAAKTYRLELS